MTATLSVVIPVFNGARFLGDTIRSLLEQTQKNFRLICIDDASSDGSADIARAAGGARMEVMRNPSRCGLGANWNRAIEMARSDLLVIAHQDDLYDADYLQTMTAVLESHPRAFAAHCKARTIDEHGRSIAHPAGLYKDRFWSRDDPMERAPDDELSALQRGNYVIAPAVMLRTRAVAEIGRFNERYEFVTDWEYWLRGVLAGHTLVGVPSRLMSFRRHADTATRAHERTMRRYEEELELLEWLARVRPGDRAYAAIENTLLADFVERLASGDRGGARQLALFARRRVPRFAGSLRERVMRFATAGGTIAGRALRLAEHAYLRIGKA